MRSGEEIQSALRAFAGQWRGYAGSERGEAQTYLNELIRCYGADRRAVGAEFEDAHTARGIMDMHWPGVCIVEMKAPGQAGRLAEHRKQALDYWRSSDDPAQNRPAPPYVVLCAFQRFEVWEPGRFPSAPRAEFSLDELPERYETLLFLAGTVKSRCLARATRSSQLRRRGSWPSCITRCSGARRRRLRPCVRSSCRWSGACSPRTSGCWRGIRSSGSWRT